MLVREEQQQSKISRREVCIYHVVKKNRVSFAASYQDNDTNVILFETLCEFTTIILVGVIQDDFRENVLILLSVVTSLNC